MIWLHHAISWSILYEWYKRNYKDKKFLSFFIFLWVFFPDFDFIFKFLWIDSLSHKTLTHSLLFFWIIFFLVYLIFIKILKKDFGIYLKLFSLWYIYHLILDIIVWWKIYLYYVNSNINYPLEIFFLKDWYFISLNFYNINVMIYFIILLYLNIRDINYYWMNIKNIFITYLLILISFYWDLLFVFHII